MAGAVESSGPGSGATRKRHRKGPSLSRDVAGGPVRTCVGCHDAHPVGDLLRVTLDLDGRLVLDPKHRAGGRGAYLCYRLDCVENALKKRRLARALEVPLGGIEPAELTERIAGAVLERVRHLLSIGQKAGLLISGTDSLERALTGLGVSRVQLVLVSSDLAEGSLERIARWAQRAGVMLYRTGLEKGALGAAIGKEVRVAIAVVKSPVAAVLEGELKRLMALTRPREVSGRRGRRRDTPDSAGPASQHEAPVPLRRSEELSKAYVKE